MKGQTDGTFLPDGRLTFAEAMTLSARLHSTLHSESIEEASTGQAVWYEPYALYAKENGILKEEPDSYDRRQEAKRQSCFFGHFRIRFPKAPLSILQQAFPMCRKAYRIIRLSRPCMKPGF